MYSRFKWDVRPQADAANVVEGKNYRFTVLTPSLIRLEYSSNGIFEDRASQVAFYRDFPACEYSCGISNGVLSIETDKLMLIYQVGSSFEEGLMLKLKDEPASAWQFGDDFETLGGTYETLDQVDGRCDMGNGVCSRNGFAVLDDSSTLLLEEDGWIGIRKENNSDHYFFGFGYDYVGAVQTLYRLTGVPPMLPAYALGNWWSRYYAYTQQEYLDLMDRFHEENIPFSVGVVDMDWHITQIPEELKDPNPRFAGGWTGYTWNKELFPDYKDFLKQLHKRNIKTAMNLHPAAGTLRHEEMYDEMARANGIDPSTGQRVPLDILSQEHMKTYFDILHHPYEEAGVDFWWMDWQQGTDYWWIHEPNKKGEYKDPRERVTPLWMLNHLHILDICRNGKRPMFFSRYSGPGGHRYPVGFSGDTTITWDSLKFQPEFTATASNIGYSWWSHDIGGHTYGVYDHELYIRWLQLGVFSPINRLHSTKQRHMFKEPWNYPMEQRAVAGQWLRMRHAMFPYLYTMNHRNHADLLPLVQPMYYSHPKCHEAYKCPTQFWFGSELMVSPIVEKGEEGSGLGRADLWLPKGNWFDFFTGMRYASKRGRNMEVYRSLDKMPVFAKAGAIVPMALFEDKDNRLSNCENMQVLVFPGESNVFTLYEDGGDGCEYENGAFATTKLELTWGSAPTFTIHKSMGDISLIPKSRKWRIGFRGFNRNVVVDSYDASWDYETNTLWVTISVDSLEAATVTIRGEDLIHDNCDWLERCDRIIGLSQIAHKDKEHLWNKINGIGFRKTPSLLAKVVNVRGFAIPGGKALAEMLTLTDDPFTGSQI